MPSALQYRPRFFRLVLFGFMAMAVGVLAVLSVEARREMRLFQEDPVDNIHWNLTQLELDLVLLLSAAELALQQDEPPLDDLRKRYDLFYSRIEMVRSGTMFERLDLEVTIRALTARLDGFLQRTTPLIDGSDASLRTALPALVDDVQALRMDMRSMLIRTVEQYATESDQRRDELARLLRQIAATSAALLSLLVVLLMSVLYLNRQAERKTDEALRMSSRLRATVATALDGVIVAGLDGRVLDFNEAAERIFGFRRDEAIGQVLEQLIIPARHVAGHNAGMARMRNNGRKKVVDAGRIQITAKRKCGEEFPVEMSITSDSGPDGMIFIAFLRDISEPVANERALLAARDKALAAEQAKTDFLAVMSHEMRTPLNGVIAALEIVGRKAIDPSQAKFVRLAQSSAKQLLRHVNDVLDISKVEAGHLALSESTFELAPLLTSLVDVLRPLAAQKATEIELEIGPDLPLVRGDSFRLGQIVQNLLSNAVKFTDGGKVVLKAIVQPEGAGMAMLDLSVTDSGIGIAPEDLERIFEDFVMLDPSYGRTDAGTGLGLAISRRLAEAMGGRIGAESEIGKGSRFWLRLPMQTAGQAAPAPAEPARAVVQDSTDTPALDLLVVEDNATNRVVMEEMLRLLGHRATLATDGGEGVTEARAHRYDAILMDISMPVMDGMTATGLIRAEGLSKDSWIVAVTAHTMPEELAKFRGAGMDDCLTKPMSIRDLAHTLATITANRLSPPPPAAPAPAPAVLDAGRIEELRQALGAEGMQRTVAQFLRNTDATMDRLRRAAPSPAEAQALCHELAGVAAMVGAANLHRHFAGLEARLRTGDASVVAAAQADTDRLWAEAAAALGDLAEA
jgi:PAS domain S-box-containing protein